MEEGILTDKPMVKRPVERPRRRWEVSIRVNFKERGINMRNRIDSAQVWDNCKALVNATFSRDFS